MIGHPHDDKSTREREACPRLDDAGAYVLHALDEDEARSYAEHLETCEVCAPEVASLQAIADTLPMAAPQLVPPPHIRDRLMSVVESEAELLRAAGPEADRPAPARREPAPPRRRGLRERLGWPTGLSPAFAAALAAVLVLAGAGAGVLISDGDDDGGAVRTLAAQEAPAGAEVAVEVHDDRATLVARHLPSPSPGRVYQVWLRRGEIPEPTHTLFTVRPDGRAQVEVDEPLRGAEEVLVTEEPSGGSVIPSGQPVIAASLDS